MEWTNNGMKKSYFLRTLYIRESLINTCNTFTQKVEHGRFFHV
uniref:Uncharacterized protein n=1 Tax=Leclercia adecarboxylata TaxID=83655 RepID=A0A7D5FVI4_9ENTR|nr:hypothetical protein [Leclercia adecarboxylata]